MDPPKFRLMLSEKLQPTVLVVPCDESTSRLYNLQKANKDGSVRYFLCSKCRHLNREQPFPALRSTVVARINGCQLETGDGTHHPSCLPTSNDQIRATEIHRSCKLLLKEGVLTAAEAYEKAVAFAAAENSSVLAQLRSWKEVNNAYYFAAAQGKAVIKRKNDDTETSVLRKRPDFGSVDN